MQKYGILGFVPKKSACKWTEMVVQGVFVQGKTPKRTLWDSKEDSLELTNPNESQMSANQDWLD